MCYSGCTWRKSARQRTASAGRQGGTDMKIAMIGSGAAGSVFACYLRLGGAELYLVDRYAAHLEKAAGEGMTFVTPEGERLITGFHTAGSAAELPEMDLVILMVKATQNDDVMPDVMKCVGPETVLVSLQNGLGNDDTLSKYVPRSRIMYGAGVIGTELRCPGVCAARPEQGVIMFFGAAERSELTHRAGQALEACFNAGGCSAVFEEDVRPRLWKKAIANSGYNTVSALLRLKVGQTLSDPRGERLVRAVWQEGCAVAQAAGVGDLRPALEAEFANVASGLADYYPSMAQDAMRHRQTEISVLNGALVRLGQRYGVPTPVNQALTWQMECIQANYANQYSDPA